MKFQHRFEVLCVACRIERSFTSKAQRTGWMSEHRRGEHDGTADFVEWEADVAEDDDGDEEKG